VRVKSAGPAHFDKVYKLLRPRLRRDAHQFRDIHKRGIHFEKTRSWKFASGGEYRTEVNTSTILHMGAHVHREQKQGSSKWLPRITRFSTWNAITGWQFYSQEANWRAERPSTLPYSTALLQCCCTFSGIKSVALVLVVVAAASDRYRSSAAGPALDRHQRSKKKQRKQS